MLVKALTKAFLHDVAGAGDEYPSHKMMPGESEDALNGPNPIGPWRPMKVKERFIVLRCDSNIPRQSCSPVRSFRGESLIESDDDSAGAEDFLHDNDNAYEAPKEVFLRKDDACAMMRCHPAKRQGR